MSTLVCSENNVKGKHVCCTSKGRDWKVKDMHRHLSWLQFMASVMNNNECNGCVGCTTTDVAHQYCNWQFSTLMSSTAIGARWGSFCSDACEKLHSGGRDQKVDSWKDGKKKLNTLSLLLQEWCRLYVLWQNSMVPDLSLPSRTRYSPHGKHLGYLKNVHNSELSNTIFKSVLWTFLPLQMQKVWKTWCFLVGLVTIGQENHKNCMDNLFHFMHLFFKRILWASWQTATFQPVLLGGAAHNFQMCREGKQQRSIRGQVSYSWKCGTKSAMNVQLNTGYLAEACQPACCKGMQSHRNLPSQPSLLLAHTSLLAFHL